MTDSRLRGLERRYKETDSVEDEAAYLLEAVRVGALGRNKLELAGDLGYPAARRALGEEPLQEAALTSLGNDLRQRWGQWELVRISLTLARRVVPSEEPLATATGLVVRGLLKSVEEWIADPRSTTPVRRQQYQLNAGELVAWAGEEVAGVVQHTLWAVTRPPARGSPSTHGCQAPLHACEILGFEWLLAVLGEDLIPRILAVEG